MLKSAALLLDGDARTQDMVIEDLYSLVRGIELDAVVPSTIRDQFDIARHAFIYSWFVYEFTMLAERQCYAVLEMALRQRLYPEVQPNATKSPGLGKLIQTAVARGILRREDFTISGAGGPVCGLNFLRQSRNHLEHGNINLLPQFALMVMQKCAEVINRLFSSQSRDTKPHE
jgi:hypothetical protein